MKARLVKTWSWLQAPYGESYQNLGRYFWPEFITALILYSLPYFIDCYFVGCLKSTELYTISGVVDNVLNVFVKSAEGLSIGVVALAGFYNGQRRFKEAGQTFVDAFWTTVLIGGGVATVVFVGAYLICYWFHFTPEMIEIAAPFIRLRAFSTLCMFISFAFIGFLRSVKNTFMPMLFFAVGALVFIVTDYVCIFGKFGIPEFGILGSAIASCAQYGVMVACACLYVLYSSVYCEYGISLFAGISSWHRVRQLLYLALPIVIDKTMMAWAYVWLAKMISGLGSHALASFSAVKLLERMAFVPAVAWSQVITFLVSNDLGGNNWDRICDNIKRVVLVASIMVALLLIVFSFYSENIIHLIDQQNEFGYITKRVFPALSILVFFDLLQLILSGALRGAAQVQLVMVTRVIILLCYFVPMSYAVSMMDIFSSKAWHFFFIYASFFVGNAMMSVVYIIKFAQKKIRKGDA